MNNILRDIGEFIFVENIPEKADGIMVVGGLICKAFHARRSLMFYQAAFPGVEFLLIPISGYNISKDNWYLTEYGVRRVLGELKRCGDQFTFEDINNYIK